jgi:uncharacterized protein (TIGR03437 family)
VLAELSFAAFSVTGKTSIQGIATNAAGEVYVTGTTSASDFPVLNASQPGFGGNTDAFVAKLSPTGGLLWATYLGGSGQDASIGLRLDSSGNVYVAGNTSSTNFPVTLPRIGVLGQNSVFVAKYTTAGRLVFSVLAGGELTNTAIGIAVDPGQENTYVDGYTNSTTFPITAGALITTPPGGNQSNSTFLLKLSGSGKLVAGTYLGGSGTVPGALLVDSAGNIIVESTSQAVAPQATALQKLNPSLSQVLASTTVAAGSGLPGALAMDDQGNIFATGVTFDTSVEASLGAYASPPSNAACAPNLEYYGGGRVFVAKLSAADWKPVYTAVFEAPCTALTGGIAVDSSGAVLVGLASAGGLPLHNPLLGGPTCSPVNAPTGGAIAKLSPDGSTLLFATYLDACGAPVLAIGAEQSVLAGVNPSGPQNSPGVLRIATLEVPSISLDRIANAFSGHSTGLVEAALYTLTGSPFDLSLVDLGLNPAQGLPTTLAGAEVLVDGVPAGILQTSSDHVIIAAPTATPAREPSSSLGFRWVQLIVQGIPSNRVWMPISSEPIPGLLTSEFPRTPSSTDLPAGVVRNEDGTVNSPQNPATQGSSVTLYVTGMGSTTPPLSAGVVTGNTVETPIAPVFSDWMSDPASTALSVTSIPGFVSGLFQIQLPVDFQTYVESVPGPNGSTEYLFGLEFGISYQPLPPVSNVVGMYVKLTAEAGIATR